MNRIVSLFAAVAMTALSAATAPAADATVGDITVAAPWARASAGPAANGAAFMTLNNAGTGADRLVAAAAEVAATVELHTHIREGDIMRMRAVEAIEVPAQGVTELKPGGLHVMLIGLKAPLKEGATFPLTLSFEKAGDVTVEVTVAKAGAMESGHGAMHGHGAMPAKKP
ncbi:MAG: copper chaperone PCu(A)C [Rhodospirillales bacterium]